MRTIPDISMLLYPLDQAIDNFIKIIFDSHDFNIIERKLWSLPVRMGGMGIPIPSEISDMQYANSRSINEMLTSKVRDQKVIYEDVTTSVKHAKFAVKTEKAERNQKLLDEITENLGTSEKGKALEAALEKGASS